MNQLKFQKGVLTTLGLIVFGLGGIDSELHAAEKRIFDSSIVGSSNTIQVLTTTSNTPVASVPYTSTVRVESTLVQWGRSLGLNMLTHIDMFNIGRAQDLMPEYDNSNHAEPYVKDFYLFPGGLSLGGSVNMHYSYYYNNNNRGIRIFYGFRMDYRFSSFEKAIYLTHAPDRSVNCANAVNAVLANTGTVDGIKQSCAVIHYPKQINVSGYQFGTYWAAGDQFFVTLVVDKPFDYSISGYKIHEVPAVKFGFGTHF